ncbi:hypothetical protein HaLaN_07517 [Haematococcus lacustris]|uniref:Uncharacterized protein n=1 Tax=Haematococcus lacustris TaxID=44745 RepID=A0A699YZ87_HAELA|nr:hypothetical protein HaLaN_07517 [Haematococcus lacustris]
MGSGSSAEAASSRASRGAAGTPPGWERHVGGYGELFQTPPDMRHVTGCAAASSQAQQLAPTGCADRPHVGHTLTASS